MIEDVGVLILREIKEGLEQQGMEVAFHHDGWSSTNQHQLWVTINDRGDHHQGCNVGYNYEAAEIEVYVIPRSIAISDNHLVVGPTARHVPFDRALYTFNVAKEGSIDEAISIIKYTHDTRKELISSSKWIMIAIVIFVIVVYLYLITIVPNMHWFSMAVIAFIVMLGRYGY